MVKAEANHSYINQTWKLEYSASIRENLVEMLSSVQSSLKIAKNDKWHDVLKYTNKTGGHLRRPQRWYIGIYIHEDIIAEVYM